MEGTIIKGIAGFYYVAVEEEDGSSARTGAENETPLPANLAPREGMRIYQCRARGIFRKEKKKPLVGDRVVIEVLDADSAEANLVQILPRKNQLIRPASANIDQALVFFALKEPDPDAVLIDLFLILMQRQGIPVLICLNKSDLADPAAAERWKEIYEGCGYRVLLTSAGIWARQKEEHPDPDHPDAPRADREGPKQRELAELRQFLDGKTTVIAGPSGVGKSTLTNVLQNTVTMETGAISRKLHKGKNTTRHAELIPLGSHTFFCDTPGFASLELPDMKKEELQDCFPEFARYEGNCRFQGCSHVTEPDCGVQDAVREGKIAAERYENYCRFYRELQDRERHRYS